MRNVLIATLMGLAVGLAGLTQAGTAQAADALQIGSVAVVNGTDGSGLRLRTLPGMSQRVLTVMPEGDRVTIVSGPMTVDGFDWYEVKTNTMSGWSRGMYLSPPDRLAKSASGPGLEAAQVTTQPLTGTRSFMAKVTTYSTGNPGVGTRTATGTPVQWGTVSIDPRVIPFGSQMLIEGFGDMVFTAEDRGGGVVGNMVDIFFPDGASAGKFGTQQRKVTIVREGYGR